MDRLVRMLRTDLYASSAIVVVFGVLGQGLSLGAHAYIANVIGTEGFGEFTFVQSWIEILLTIAIVGFDQSALKFVAVYKSEERASEVARFLRFARRASLAASLAAGVVVLAVLLPIGTSSSLAWTFVIGMVVLPVWAQMRINYGALMGAGAVPPAQFALSIARPAAWLVLAFVGFEVLGLDESASVAMGTQLVAVVGVTMLLFVSLARIPFGQVASDEPEAHPRDWLRVSVPLTISSGMSILLTRSDIVLVGLLVGTEEAGIYAVGVRLAAFLTFGLSAANQVASPAIARAHHDDDNDELQRVVTQASWFSTSFVVLAGLALILVSPLIISVFGDGFEDAREILVVLALMRLANALVGPVGQTLNMTGHELVNSRILGRSVVLNILTNVPLIVLMGPIGAAIATTGVAITKSFAAWRAVQTRVGVNSSILGSTGGRRS